MRNSRQSAKTIFQRATAFIMAAVFGSLNCAALAATEERTGTTASRSSTSSVPPSKKPAATLSATQRAAQLKPMRKSFVLDKNPADLAIETSRAFEEPLTPMTGPALPGENAALSKALSTYKQLSNPEDLSSLDAFVKGNPNSRWRAALQLNMGLLQLETGYISQALTNLKAAWTAAKSETGSAQKAVADRAISELLILQARLGERDDLKKGLDEVAGRRMLGSNAERLGGARSGLRVMERGPKLAYRCGPYALNSLLNLNRKSPTFDLRLKAFTSTDQGTNLQQVKSWANQVGLKMQAAKRSPGAPLVVPCVMHWRIGHFAAITAEKQGRYRVQDPTFERMGNLWMSPKAIDAESDGYFLVADGTLPRGWAPVSDDEAAKVWGKGFSEGRNGSNTSWTPRESCVATCKSTGGGGESCSIGLAKASAFSMPALLNIRDVPLQYDQPIGPPMQFLVNYTQNEQGQPTFTFSNLGPNWSLNWISWLHLDASNNARVSVRGGGVETYLYTGNPSDPYAPELTSQALLTVPSAGVYHRNLPDGSIEVYDLSDTNGNYFLTAVIDPQSNTSTISYDPTFRVNFVADANGNKTTFSYLSSTVGDPGYYLITGLTDAFGRSASFAYDPSNTYLTSITDQIGLVSRFSYDTTSGFIQTLTTPYGSTSFYSYTPAGGMFPPRGLRFNFPDGTSAVLESWLDHDQSTYYWDREAVSQYPNDPDQRIYSHCKITKWEVNGTTLDLEPVAYWQKMPLESQVTFAYDGGDPYPVVGTTNRPTSIIRTAFAGPATPMRSVGVATILGAITPGDQVTITVLNGVLPDGQLSLTYTVLNGDTIQSIAASFANLINDNTLLHNANVTAVAAANQLRLFGAGTSYLASVSPGATEIVDVSPTQNPPSVLRMSGTATVGDQPYINVLDNSLPGSFVLITHTVAAGESINDVIAAFAQAINTNTNLQSMGMVASAAGNVLTVQSYSSNLTQYIEGFLTSNPTEVWQAEVMPVQTWTFAYNSFGNRTLSVDPLGRKFSYIYASNKIDLTEIRETQGIDNFLLGKWEYNSQHVPTLYIDGSGQRWQYGYNVFGERTSSLDPLSGLTTYTYTSSETVTVGGTATTGNTATITVHDPALSGGQKSVSYTLVSSDTLNSVATKLRNKINNDVDLQALGVSATSSAAVITIKSTSVNATTYTQSTSGTVTLSLSPVSHGFLTAVRGPLQQQDITSFAWNNNGTLKSTTGSEGYTLNYAYDAADRLTKTTFPDGTTEQIKYRNIDPVAFIDRLGRTTQQGYDSMDQMVFEIDPLGRKTQYTWCACGSLAALTDAANHTTQWNHDLEGRVVQKVYADNTSTSYVYGETYSRLIRRIDALNQKTDYQYNIDDTIGVVKYSDTVNPTSNVSYKYDSKFNRLTQAKNGWGQYDYVYNNYITDPDGPAITGGGRLQSITNTAMPNSTITFLYDELGRTINRSINGSANSINWSYDAMSRVTQEVNALGTFGYTYVDNVSPNSKGVTRLASISYPNGQVTNFSWFDNNRDQRLRQISNLDPSAQALSQFDYSYDAAGQITRWLQHQKGSHQNFTLDYDPAGQLTGAVAGIGLLAPPYANQSFYSYDLGANRTAVQTSQVQNIVLGGTPSAGDQLTVTVLDSALSGGSQSVVYTVAAGDSLPTIAANLAATITADSNLQAIGVDAVSNGTTITLRSKSPNITTYTASLSGGATETLTLGINNAVENMTIGGTAHAGDVVQVIVHDPALSGGQTIVSYTVPASPTLNSIASGLATAINGGAGLSALGVSATPNNTVITVQSTSQNVTTYTGSVSGAGATTTLSLGQAVNGSVTALIGGSAGPGDTATLTVVDVGLSGGSKAIAYSVISGDTPTSIASGLAAAINVDSALQVIGVTAVSSGPKLTLTSVSTNATTYLASTKNSSGSALGTETILLGLPANGTTTASIAGTVDSGDQFTLTVFDAGLSGGSLSKTVTGVTTPNSVASALASAINGDSVLSAIGVTAAAAIPTASVSVVNISSTSNNATTYTLTRTGLSSIALSKNVGVTQATFNNVNELTAISAGGAIRFQGNTDRPVQPVTINGNPTMMLSSQSFIGNPTLPSGATSTSVSATAGGGSGTTTNSYTLNAIGASSVTLTFDANGNMTSDGTNSYSWDAENRLLQITYPGSGNNSQFAFDPFGRNVKIEERSGGSLTSTKQFVWCGSRRCEERDAGGSVTRLFFGHGERISTTSCQYSSDYLGSIREMSDGSGVIQAQYFFDPYGRTVKLQGTVDSDFQYAGYYQHGRSGLALAVFRTYSPALGRWLSRDPIAENGGVNLYAYVSNAPVNAADLYGLFHYYENWGGPQWTNNSDEWSESADNFPIEGDPRYVPPADPRDWCYYYHDVCLHNQSANPDDKSRRDCRGKCDQLLAECLEGVKKKYPDNKNWHAPDWEILFWKSEPNTWWQQAPYHEHIIVYPLPHGSWPIH